LGNESLYGGDIGVDLGLKAGEKGVPLAADLQRASTIKSHFLFDLLYLLGLFEEFAALCLPLLVPALGVVFLFHQGRDLAVDCLEVLYYFVVGLFLRHSHVFGDLFEFALDLPHEAVLLRSDLASNAFPELAAAQPLVEFRLSGAVALELQLGLLHHLARLAHCLEAVILVTSEQRAMRTQPHAVSQANQLELFPVKTAQIALALAPSGSAIPRVQASERGFWSGAAFAEQLGEGDILGEVFEVYSGKGLLVAAVAAGNFFGLALAEQLPKTGSAGAVLAGRHHPRLAALRKDRSADAAALFFRTHPFQL
jgi:hypothetical protein